MRRRRGTNDIDPADDQAPRIASPHIHDEEPSADKADLNDIPAPRLANALSGFTSVVMSLASAAPRREQGEHVTPSEHAPANADDVFAAMLSEPLWARYCDAVPLGERKKSMLEVIDEFVSLAPLVELPDLYGPKQMLRDTMALARELKRLIEMWDEGTEPTTAMTSMSIAILDAMRSAPLGDTA